MFHCFTVVTLKCVEVYGMVRLYCGNCYISVWLHIHCVTISEEREHVNKK